MYQFDLYVYEMFNKTVIKIDIYLLYIEQDEPDKIKCNYKYVLQFLSICITI